VLGRRGVLGGAALGVLALAACDTDDLRPPEDEAAPTPTPSGTEAPEAEPDVDADADADTRLAEDVAAQMAAALVLVDRTRRTFPRLRGRLQPIARMHRAHLEVLVAPGDRSVPAPQVGDTPAAALAALFTVEDALRRRLAAAAVEARSGALARLLASTSASVAQHVHVTLPAPATEGGPR
jgi:hypothetical protein